MVSDKRFFDYIIIGQGLAGSLLAWRLIQQKKKVLVVDDGHRSASSKVAAGLINPLAGMRFNHSPQVHQWLEEVDTLYRELESTAGRRFLHWQPMVRLFRSPEQVRFYRRRAADPNDLDLLAGSFAPEQSCEPVHAPHGGFLQQRTGHLDLPALLGFVGNWLKGKDALRQEFVEYDQIALTPDRVQIGDLEARHLIFCDGYRGMHTPWFGHLPFSPDKGEFLVLEPSSTATPDQLPRRIVNGAHWLLRHADGYYRLGSTHDHRHQDQQPTEAGKRRLLEGLEKLLRHPGALAARDHQAGVRPTTSDRQPFLGTHPEQPRLHLFNGFGAHGSLSIPWYSKQMAGWLLEGRPLPSNADILRFRSGFPAPGE